MVHFTQPVYLSSEQAARIIGCSANALIKAVTDGRLKCIRPIRSRWRLFEVNELNRWLINRPECHQPGHGYVTQIDAATLRTFVVARNELVKTAELAVA